MNKSVGEIAGNDDVHGERPRVVVVVCTGSSDKEESM